MHRLTLDTIGHDVLPFLPGRDLATAAATSRAMYAAAHSSKFALWKNLSEALEGGPYPPTTTMKEYALLRSLVPMTGRFQIRTEPSGGYMTVAVNNDLTLSPAWFDPSRNAMTPFSASQIPPAHILMRLPPSLKSGYLRGTYCANYGTYHGNTPSWKLVDVTSGLYLQESFNFVIGRKLNSFPLSVADTPDFKFQLNESCVVQAQEIAMHGIPAPPGSRCYWGDVLLGGDYVHAALILPEGHDGFLIYYLEAQFRLVFRRF